MSRAELETEPIWWPTLARRYPSRYPKNDIEVAIYMIRAIESDSLPVPKIVYGVENKKTYVTVVWHKNDITLHIDFYGDWPPHFHWRFYDCDDMIMEHCSHISTGGYNMKENNLNTLGGSISLMRCIINSFLEMR